MSFESTETKEPAEAFLRTLESRGYTFFTGVPCSLLKDLFVVLEKRPAADYVAATREDLALGTAAGAVLAGRKSAVLMQNSGLGVSINALASLNILYEIPVLLVISWRGQGGQDAPEHLVMGKVTHDLLRSIEIPAIDLNSDSLTRQVEEADDLLTRTRKPVALIVPRGIFDGKQKGH